MAKMLICDGTLSQAKAGLTNVNNVLACDTGYQVIDYVPPADSTAIYAQLVALNDFDPVQIAGIVTFCMVLFIIGFGAAVVMNRLRRS